MPPPIKSPQTDAICEQVRQVTEQADAAEDTLRISLDAKATVDVGPFSRRGRSRTGTEGADHDFEPEAKPTPSGLFLPRDDDLSLFMTGSPITADFIADRLERWWEGNRERFPGVTMLVLNLDNGPENHSRRTRFPKRMVEFAHGHRIDIRLAYYPPYHSKYNPIERCRGILELHRNGSLLDSVVAVLGFAGTMTWKGKHPAVALVEASYAKGVWLDAEEMRAVESEVNRLPSPEKWFVEIPAIPQRVRAN